MAAEPLASAGASQRRGTVSAAASPKAGAPTEPLGSPSCVRRPTSTTRDARWDPPAGTLKLALDHVLVVYDEIDLPFGEIRARLGGGLAGHNGLKSLKRELGSADFMRVRVGVGRPDSTDPEIVSA